MERVGRLAGRICAGLTMDVLPKPILHSLSAKSDAEPNLRKFALVTGALVIVLFGILIPWLFALNWPLWPWVIGLSLAAWGLVHPSSLGPVYRGWMRFGEIAGWVNSRIVLGFVFYVVVLPFGMVMRLFGRDPMARSRSASVVSYRVASAPQPKNHFERPF